MRERFEQRLFRIFAQAGYSPAALHHHPGGDGGDPRHYRAQHRAVLCVQNKVLADRNKVRSGSRWRNC